MSKGFVTPTREGATIPKVRWVLCRSPDGTSIRSIGRVLVQSPAASCAFQRVSDALSRAALDGLLADIKATRVTQKTLLRKGAKPQPGGHLEWLDPCPEQSLSRSPDGRIENRQTPRVGVVGLSRMSPHASSVGMHACQVGSDGHRADHLRSWRT